MNVHFVLGGDTFDDVCNYQGGGTLINGISDDDTLGSYCYFEVLTMSGSPGKLKGKGMWVYYDLNDGYWETGTFTVKQS